ncbi:hypothetical protein LCGC14_1286040 [marine sediment metagenome]|uniref:Extracellular repeat protein, HAF family n=1 Tax=marine sediment metagenome TaxID=412755 RepID=A0A0F9NWS9_9ZZZZ
MIRFISLLSLLFCSVVCAQDVNRPSYSFTPMGWISTNFRIFSGAYAVSSTGRIAVGAISSPIGWRPYIWDKREGLRMISLPTGWVQHSYAYDISSINRFDHIIVGSAWSVTERRTEAFVYSEFELKGLGVLGSLPQPISEAEAVSGDGTVVAGYSSSPIGIQLFRWDNDGMVGLGTAPRPNGEIRVGGISRDGKTIVGWTEYTDPTISEPFIWSHDLGLQFFPPLDERFPFTHFTDVSADGGIVLGYGQTKNGIRSFWQANRPTPGPHITMIRIPSGWGVLDMEAYGMTSDGQSIVGSYWNTSQIAHTFFADKNGQVYDIQERLENAGIDMSGWTLNRASDLSDNGRTIVGWGTNIRNSVPSAKEGWVAFMPLN